MTKAFFTKFLIVILLTSILVPNILPALAAGERAGVPGSQGVGTNSCSWSIDTWGYCFLRVVGYVLEFSLNMMTYGIALAGRALDVVIKVQNSSFYDKPLVNIGWKIARDVVNIFYMLIMLIIAISTILGISGYGAKDLLWKLVISALLVNFSLPIAGVVVDTSNALGNSFYIHMGSEAPGGDGRELSTVIVEGFAPQNIYAENKEISVVSQSTDQTITNINIALFMGVLLLGVAIFVMFAAAFLLIIRIVTIWILFILSPFAFLFWVLPRTSGISNQWFEALFSQSFFYPAYMFFLYLTFAAIKNKVIYNMLSEANFNSSIMIAIRDNELGTASQLSSRVDLFLGFITLGVLLIASLIVAKKMGAHGASGAMALGDKMRKGIQGYAGSVGAGAGAYAGRLGWRAAGGVAGLAPVVAVTRHIPLVSRAVGTAISKGAQASQYRAQQEAKKLRGLDPDSRARVISTFSAEGQAEAIKKMSVKERAEMFSRLRTVSDKAPKQVAQNMQRHGALTPRESLALIAMGSNIHEAMQDMYPEYKAGNPPARYEADGVTETEEGKKYYSRMEDFLRGMTNEERDQIDTIDMLKKGNPYYDEYFLRNGNGVQDFTKNRESIEFGGKFLQKIVLQISEENEGRLLSPGEIADIIEKHYGNKALGDSLRKNNVGYNMIFEPEIVKVHQPAEKSKLEQNVERLLAREPSGGEPGTT